ncbi:MAG: hypothetical protein JWQ25_1399, partial [Daejeonella sp.]|nr:hypothetical protein [Daejeonella sp.]
MFYAIQKSIELLSGLFLNIRALNFKVP